MKPEVRKIHRDNLYSSVVTLAKTFTRELHWSNGDYVAFHLRATTVILEKVNFMESK